MRVTVTGSSGFIGSAVVRELGRQGHECVPFDRDTGQDILVDTLPDAEHVIHLAGVLGTDELFDEPELAIDVNVKGTLNVLRWCVDSGAGYTGITQPPVFPSVYTATRMCSAHLARAWHHTYGVPVSIVQAFNAFGPGQKHGPGHPRKIIPAFATEAHAGVPLIVWGDGEQTVDLIHVDDVARVLVAAIDFGDCRVFDAGTGLSFTVNQVVRMVCEAAGVNPAVDYRPMRRGEIPTEIVATGQGWELLSDKPEFRLSDLAETVEWYRS